jgi:hypothetical protein
MNVLETITVRLHDFKSAPLIKAALMHIPTAISMAPIRIDLFRNAAVQNDWQIQILRPAGRISADKSPFAVSLVESFRPIGMVHHSVLLRMSLPTEYPKNNRDRPATTVTDRNPHYIKMDGTPPL